MKDVEEKDAGETDVGEKKVQHNMVRLFIEGRYTLQQFSKEYPWIACFVLGTMSLLLFLAAIAFVLAMPGKIPPQFNETSKSFALKMLFFRSVITILEIICGIHMI